MAINNRIVFDIIAYTEKKMKDKTIIAILGILLLALVWNLQIPTTFILYGGTEYEGYVSNETGICWTLAESDRCVKQRVYLINLTKQNLLVCPEATFPTEQECKQKYGLIPEPPKPKINCYFISEDECKTEQFLEEEGCPSTYYSNLNECEEALKTPLRHIKLLFQNKFTLYAVIVGVIILIVLIIPKIRK